MWLCIDLGWVYSVKLVKIWYRDDSEYLLKDGWIMKKNVEYNLFI